MQAGQGWGVVMVSNGRLHAPHTRWFAGAGLWRGLCDRRRAHWSHIRDVWEVSEKKK